MTLMKGTNDGGGQEVLEGGQWTDDTVPDELFFSMLDKKKTKELLNDI